MTVKLFDPDGRYRFGKSTLEKMQARADTAAGRQNIEIETKDVLAVENMVKPSEDYKRAIEIIEHALATTPDERREAARRSVVAQLARERARMDRLRMSKSEQRQHLEAIVEALAGLEEWQPELKLERNDCSRLHKLKELLQDGNVLDVKDAKVTLEGEDIRQSFLKCDKTFVVQHDWARAFEGAEDFDGGDIKLPFDTCCFEFRMSGRTVVVFYSSLLADNLTTSVVIETGPTWFSPPFASTKNEKWFQFLHAQVKAICVALEAEVAVTHVERAPSALNKKRERQGKAPLADYHVVDLNRRRRIENPTARGEPTGRHVRLHFRRGHWRHYETHKTWIKWMLVGDPDLGFIQKHYRL